MFEDAYVFPFEGNPNWSKFYVGQEEILEYIKSTAEKYDLKKYVHLNTSIKETIWDEESGQWRIQLARDGLPLQDTADILINASGFLK